MPNIVKLGIAVSLAAALAYAETWSGKLVDGTCLPTKEAPAKCDATRGTTKFAIQTPDGKIIKFNAEGDIKTGIALGGFPDAKGPAVTVTGTMQDDVLKVEAIEIR